MPERLAFVTGRLARPRLERILSDLPTERYDCVILDAGVKVAALLTEAILLRRIAPPPGTQRVILPGRARADLDRLAAHFGVPFVRGPEELVDLPAWLGLEAKAADLSRRDLRLFAEIVDAPLLSVEATLAQALGLAARGADVIDLGCLPDTPYAHLEAAVGALKSAGLRVSVDSHSVDELLRGERAGADFLLSLNEDDLDAMDETSAIPVLVPRRPEDEGSLHRAIDRALAKGRPFIADAILEPIHFGFAASIARYCRLRERYPHIDMMMGTGNLTELTETDSLGMTTALLGLCSELAIGNALLVEVSDHARRSLEEHDAAGRLLRAARADSALPKGYGGLLLALHDQRPFPATPEEIGAEARAIADRNFRIAVAQDGIHVYNKDLHVRETEALAFWPRLPRDLDAGHAFYLGGELAKAEIAYRLGKRYAQDEPLDWGVAAPRAAQDATAFKAIGHTLKPREDA